ncbi:MAG TPA: hypothetical protein VFC99_04755, partial [Acidimicrobiia bacterium]|nr:hypothetical protein [Acidimicrobiia bacterium]
METSPKTRHAFNAYCFGLGFVALAIGVVLTFTTPTPDPVPMVLLGALFAIAENRCVLLANNVAVSASLMLGMAAVVVFGTSGAVLGSLVVGMCGALYVPHFREHKWSFIMS